MILTRNNRSINHFNGARHKDTHEKKMYLEPRIEISRYTQADEKFLMDFFLSNSVTYEQFCEFWNWRKDGLPESGGEQAVIAKVKDKVVGCVGLVPIKISFYGTFMNASWQQDSLVSHAVRGKGIGKRLVNEGVEGWDMALAKGTSKAMYGLRKSQGFVDVRNSDYLLMVVKSRGREVDLKKRILESGFILWRTILPLPGKTESISIKEIDTFDDDFDRLAGNLSWEPVLRPYKDKTYLNWRYFRCPKKRYKVFRSKSSMGIGAIVLNITGPSWEEGWIVDLMCDVRDRNGAYALLQRGITYLMDNEVQRVYAFTTLPSKRKWFLRFGFLPTGRTPHFTFRTQGKIENAVDFSSVPWDFNHGDGDVELYM